MAAPVPATTHHRPGPRLLVSVGATAVLLVSIVIAFATGVVDWPGRGGSAGPVDAQSPSAVGTLPPPASEPASASPTDHTDTPEPSPGPTVPPSEPPTASPATSPPSAADTFPPLVMVRAVNPGIALRAEPGLSGERLGSLAEGSRSLVVEGPVSADGLEWYRLSGPGLPPASGCITPGPTEPFECPIWYGWAATGVGHDWFVLDPTECPDPEADLYAFALLGDYEALSCASGRELEVTGWLRAYATTPEYERCPTRGDPDAPDWLWCHDRWWEALYANPDEAVFIDLYVDPASGIVVPHDGRWVSVTGHVDDSRAAGCRNSVAIGWPIDLDWAALECRAHFVVRSLQHASQP